MSVNIPEETKKAIGGVPAIVRKAGELVIASPSDLDHAAVELKAIVNGRGKKGSNGSIPRSGR